MHYGIQFGLPTLKVDDKHKSGRRPGGFEPEVYLIPPCEGLILDAEDYGFCAPAEQEQRPLKTITVILGHQRIYDVAWTPEISIYSLTQATLVPRVDCLAFDGFKPGDIFCIVIGVGLESGKFEIAWSGCVRVTHQWQVSTALRVDPSIKIALN